jgi:YfiH family protein
VKTPMYSYLPIERDAADSDVASLRSVIPFPFPAMLTLKAAGDMRRDGADRAAFLSSSGIPSSQVHAGEQVHSQHVVVIPASMEEQNPSGEWVSAATDGLITQDPECVLAVTVADCMPIFIADPGTGLRGLLHSGWKGTGILDHAITILVDEFGSDPSDLVVTMGPCISAGSYEVDAARAHLFRTQWGDDAAVVREGRHYLDLRAANAGICARRGVDLINVIDHCTFRDSHFGSFRREGPEQYTHMLALLAGKGFPELQTG